MKKLSRRSREVKELREQGLCCFEIAAQLGMSNKNVRAYAIKIGMPFTEEEKARSIRLAAEKAVRNQYGTEKERAQHNADYINQKHPGFEYVSGYVGTDNPITLRCKVCKNEVIKSAASVRGHKNLRCPFCYDLKRQQAKEKAEQEKQKQQNQVKRRKIQRFWEQSFEQTALSFCPECGTVFFGHNKYCSADCLKRACNAKTKDKRLRRIKDRRIDNNITLPSLFRRDNGKCWICGEVCDYDDYFRDENNIFIVGGNYPSIDHVIPLSKGGLHSWDNVKLAHHYCNTLKSNKVVSL